MTVTLLPSGYVPRPGVPANCSWPLAGVAMAAGHDPRPPPRPGGWKGLPRPGNVPPPPRPPRPVGEHGPRVLGVHAPL